ncbi:paraquat-inducible protein A [Tabrizicola thermarum]|uniref:paraquat-inducible protein A n=1 Tax=Tabrizicola thermarum TaxID=2670345 RepID=UPI000FFB0A12|nr:paraquat-inducible protein A [Tabrizicola thermarum]
MKYLNLALLVLFPVAWFAPLLRAAILPIFGMDEISVITGLQSLWGSDPALALIVTFLAIFAPYAKTIGLALLHWNLMSPKTLPALEILGKLAMADVFLIALYIVVVKGAGHVTIETAWGLYLFTGCILAQVLVSWTSRPTV